MDGFVVEPYANFGTDEPWVARIALGLPEIVYAVPAFGETREEFNGILLGEVVESLGIAFEELRQLRVRASDPEAPALDITRSYRNLYGALWQAYKDRFQRAMKTLGVDIGFLFMKDAEFERVAAKLLAWRPELADLVTLMRADRAEFQQNLADYRNRHLEHRGKPLDARLLASFHRLDSAQTMFDNVWGAVEDYVALTVQAHMPEQFALVEIPEEERDPMRPTRFRRALPAGLPPGESEE